MVIVQAREKAYVALYLKLESKNGENDFSKIVKARKRRNDLGTSNLSKMMNDET